MNNVNERSYLIKSIIFIILGIIIVVYIFKNFFIFLIISLIYDAMSIRDGFWPDQSGKVYGYCDLGGIVHTDTEELPKEYLVFIIYLFRMAWISNT